MLDLLFFIAGVWALIAGSFPKSIFKLLFGKGEYEMPSSKVRVIGLFLAMPLPITFLASIVITAVFGKKYTVYTNIIEFGLMAAVAVVVIAMIRSPKKEPVYQAGDVPNITFDEQKNELSYGKRVLIMLGIMVLVFIVLGNIAGFIMGLMMTVQDIVADHSRFLTDFGFFGLTTLIMGLSIFGIVKLIKKLRE